MNKYNWEELRFAPDDKLPWDDYDDIKRQAKQVQETTDAALKIVNDAKVRYIKRKINARTKKQAENMQQMFEDIELYGSEKDIDDAYGWDFINEKERDRLIALFRLREKFADDNGKYDDAVTALLQIVLNRICEENADFFAVVQKMRRVEEERRKEIHRENVQFAHEKYIRGL